MAQSKKIVIFLKAVAADAYERQLREDAVNASAFFTRLIMDREKERVSKNPVGRPKLKETDDERATRIMAEPKDTPHPDQGDAFCGHNGMMVSRREAEDWCGWIDENEEKRAWAQALPYYIPKAQRIVKD